MTRSIFLFLSLFFLSACTNDGEGGVIANVYTASASTQSECASSKVTSITSPTDKPMLVVLLNYNNQTITSSLTTWANKIFGKSQGELNHYYQELSRNKFEFSEATECNGIASVTLGKNHPDRDIDSSYFDTTVYPDLALALMELDDKISFDAYDEDSNGYITPDELLITFIVAGYEDAYEGTHVSNGVWAHQSCVDASIAPTLDGVSLMNCSNDGNFALFGEKHDIASPHDASIGIIAHELGHSAFNLPDLYLGGGIGNFGLMGAGTWAYADNSQFAGVSPTHMSAWSKVYNGWVTPNTSIGTGLDLNATSSLNYNVRRVENGARYYLIENRANSGYDQGLSTLRGDFQGGLAIWEIDDSRTTQVYIDNNSVNADSSNKGVAMLDAQGTYVDANFRGDESALFYNGNIDLLGTNISNISLRGNTMTLDIN